eukprot:179423-Pyramimonas_sp.AAC.1
MPVFIVIIPVAFVPRRPSPWQGPVFSRSAGGGQTCPRCSARPRRRRRAPLRRRRLALVSPL